MSGLTESFSEREVEVLKAIAEGLSNHEIADKLFLAPNTVKWYVRQINSKLDTNNRDEIVAVAQSLGLLNEGKVFAASIPHNLPYQTTAFIGRDAELDELHAMLSKPEIRLLTILAQGGMGKTRIALEAAEQQRNHFQHGVFFVPLQPLTDTAQIVPHLANSTGYQIQSSDKRSDKEQVLEFLANKTMLLLIDNWEHLLDGAGIISEILQAAPNVKVLATSREKLNLSGETAYHLRGMEFPNWESPADALEYDAVRLLVEAAKRVKHDWTISSENLNFVSRICRLTDGMPLGILLAVAWLDMLSLEEIAEEIQKNVDFLETSMRDVPERQRSIRAIFETAWNRLEPFEQQVFKKMAVFRAGCTREAAEGITGANLRILQTLVNKALLIRRKDERFEIHELLRQYAENELNRASQVGVVRDAHSRYYAEAIQRRESWLHGGRQLEALKDIEEDFENVRAAWQWAILMRDWKRIDQMLNSLALFCGMKGRFLETKTLLGMVLDQLSPESDAEERQLWGRLLVRWYYTYTSVVSYAKLNDLERAVLIARETQDAFELATSLRTLSYRYDSLGQTEQAWELAEETLRLSRASKDKYSEIQGLLQISFLAAARQSKMTVFAELTLEAIAIAREINDIVALGTLLDNYGLYCQTIKDYAAAEKNLGDSLRLRRMTASHPAIQHSLTNLSVIYAVQGKFELAHDNASEALAVAQHMNNYLNIGAAWYTIAYIHTLEGNFSRALEILKEVLGNLRETDNLEYHAEAKAHIAISYCGLGNYEQAASLLYASLEPILSHSQIFELVETLFGLTLVLAYHEDLPKRATEIASLISQHPAMLYWDAMPLVPPLLEHLKKVLGTDAYNAAWERGKSLDLRTTARQIMEEFAPKQNPDAF